MRATIRALAAALAACAIPTSVAAQGYQVQATATAISGACTDSDATGLISAATAHAFATCTAPGTVVADGDVDLASATTALVLDAAGSYANAAGLAQLVDNFVFQDPSHVLAPNEPLVVGVTFRLDRSVSAGAMTSTPAYSFVYYDFDIIDFYYSADPAALFEASGDVDVTGDAVDEYSGTIVVRQPFLTAQLGMTLLGQGIQLGVVDAVASIQLDLPPGITWTSSSGVLLTVPEPASALAALVALLALASRARRYAAP